MVFVVRERPPHWLPYVNAEPVRGLEMHVLHRRRAAGLHWHEVHPRERVVLEAVRRPLLEHRAI
jgi:hypothetical protein